jgi:formamidopyrimidine-DNA glycosylase
LQTASAVPTAQVHRLASEIRRILGRATAEGGSTLRDYRDAFGKPGNAVQVHAAYGREGQPCLRCGTILLGLRLQGRATVFCPRCQDLST